MSENHSTIQRELFPGESGMCLKCGEEKPIACFVRDWNSKRGYKPTCKQCLAARMREYRQTPNGKASGNATKRRRYARIGHTEAYKARQKRNHKRWHERSPRLNLHMALRHAIKRRRTINPMTTDEAMELWQKQDGKCAVSGVAMTWGKGKLMPTSVSIDRLDGSRGYEKDNIRLVCYQVNTFRGRWSDEQMLAMAKAIVANMAKP